MTLFRHLAEDAQPPWTESRLKVTDLHRARIRDAWDAYRDRLPRGFQPAGIYGFLQIMGDLGTVVDDYEERVARISAEISARRAEREAKEKQALPQKEMQKPSGVLRGKYRNNGDATTTDRALPALDLGEGGPWRLSGC